MGGAAGLISKPLPHVQNARLDSLNPSGRASCRLFSKPIHCDACYSGGIMTGLQPLPRQPQLHPYLR